MTIPNFRSPNVEILLGENSWATRKENNIQYTWNITKSMFSVGNITEKQRIAKFDCKGQIIGKDPDYPGNFSKKNPGFPHILDQFWH